MTIFGEETAPTMVSQTSKMMGNTQDGLLIADKQ